MISAIPLAASVKILSALAKASPRRRLPYKSLSLSLETTKRVSTLSRNSCIPASACILRLRPSNPKGMVTIPTVRIPISFATAAITGAAPVPVPPPIPAVINSIFVLPSKISLISSIFSIAAFLPTSGTEPAPRPSVRLAPNCTLFGIGLLSKACESVLQMIKSTPLIPCLYM